MNRLFRLIYINYIFAKNGLDQIIFSMGFFPSLRFIVYLNPWYWTRRKTLTPGEALRISLEELGPIFIKFGQSLSTRPDILPPDITQELTKLQDNVPPFPSEIALDLIDKAYGRSAFEVFEQFDELPMASASMAQVHAATLKSGEDVVVKILRPNMRRIINQDLALLKTLAHLADRYWPEGKRFKPKEIVQEFEHSLLDELDLRREAANGGQLRRNFKHSPLLYVPEIYWDYVRDNVLVMERIYGIPVSDFARLQEYGINIPLLAERGVEIFFTQVFRDCFFHADMHPGNIFVSFEHPDQPQYICIDFGIMGTLNETDKRYLAENLLAFFNEDYRRVAQLHIESGWVDRSTRLEDFESAIRTVCEPIIGKPLKDISFATVLLQLFQVTRRFQMAVQPQLILLQKTLFAVEGLSRQLCPDLDLSVTAKPFLEKWLRDQIGPKAFFRHLRENIPFLVEQLPHMPRLINDVLVLSKENKLAEAAALQALVPIQTRYARRNWFRGFGCGVFVMMLVAGIASYRYLGSHHLATLLTLSAAISGGVIMLMSRKEKGLV